MANFSKASSKRPCDTKFLTVCLKSIGFELASNSNSDIGNQVILLQSRYNGVLKGENSGIMDTREANIERNRITSAILSLLDELT